MDTSRSKRKHHTIAASVLVPLRTNATIAYRASSTEKEDTEHVATVKLPGRRMTWKKSIISLLCVFILLPVLGFAGVTTAGSLWVDQAKLGAFYTSVTEGKVSPEGYPVTSIEVMPTYISDSLVAIEDHRFYMHPGIDPVGLVRSVWVDLKEGRKAQGGSTITMQLSRNLFLTHEKSFERKLKEISIAANLEWNYSKKDLLNMYLNKVYFGHGIYGIETAAQQYFDKTTAMNGTKPTINLAESAMLIGMLKAPERYSPVKDLSKAKQRQQVVLNRMHKLGLITQEQWNEAKSTMIVIHPKASLLADANANS